VALTWSTDVSAGAWLTERIIGFARDVGSVVPHGFEAYARVFHPLDDGRWADRAARNGRIAHAEMQLHLISAPPGSAPAWNGPLDEGSVGSLPEGELRALVEVLARHTGTPEQVTFAVWEGGGLEGGSAYLVRDRETVPVPSSPLAPPEVLDGPRLELPNRSYVLLEGSVADAGAVATLLRGQSPNLWWPQDRAWCVGTEIDFSWTYVGGTEDLVADVLASPVLEALRTRLTDAVTYDGDLLNAALDAR
jgi:hypothetical protein